MELLIKGAKIVDAEKNINGDIYMKDGVIVEIGENIKRDCRILEAKGLTLLPSFIDTHTHFREPGFTYKEDLLTGAMAATKGGYTAVNLMPNTKPVCSSMEIVNQVINKSKEIGLVDVHQTISITRDFTGSDISHLKSITKPVKMVTEDGNDVDDSNVMLEAMAEIRDKGLKVMVHSEHKEIAKKDTRLSENIMSWRNLELARVTECPIHMAHVSTLETMKYIINAKKNNQQVTCEVMPHHIALTDDIDYKVNPPLRKQEDVDFLIKAIKDGYVDSIGTDHAPHTEEDKAKGAPGISGIETSFSVCYTSLVENGHISLNKLSEIMSKNPAEILGFNKGLIKVGYDADMVLVDLHARNIISTDSFASKGKNTPFDKMEYKGEVLTTIKSGLIVYNNGTWFLNNGKVNLNNWWMSA